MKTHAPAPERRAGNAVAGLRIAYLGQMADVSTENGISKKIRSQVKAWAERGHVVRYFSLTPTATVWPGFIPVETELLVRGRGVTRVRRSFTLAARIRAWEPDVIYFRYAYHSPGMPALFRSIPAVAEINSDDLLEYPLTLSPANIAYHRLFRHRVLRAVRGFVTVTCQLASRFASYGRPTEAIGNGIDLDEHEPLPVSLRPDRWHLVFIGSARTPWHGLDRVGELARLCPAAAIDIIGCDVEDWRQATNGSIAPPPSLTFHGPLGRKEYEPLLARATAAIGTMGLYRKHMDEACPLKVREYLARGLPVIAAYEDTDIPSDADYFLRLPNNAGPLAPERERLHAFLAAWQGRRVPRDRIQHLGTSSKEDARLRFLARFVPSAQAHDA